MNGDYIEGSNIVDLIHFMTAIKVRKNAGNPSGLDDFVDLLRRLNVPTSMLGTEGLLSMNKQRYLTKENMSVDNDLNLDKWFTLK